MRPEGSSSADVSALVSRPQAREEAVPPRLLEVVTRLDVGGVPAHLMLLVEGLRGRGYDITVACGDCDADHAQRLARLGIPVVNVPMRRLLSPMADIRALAQLCLLIRRGGFDVVHTHMSKAALLGGIAARLARAPVAVNTAHNLGSIAMPKRWLRALFWVYDKTLLTLTTDVVVTVSQWVRDDVVRRRVLSPGRLAMIPNGHRSALRRTQTSSPLASLLASNPGADRLIVGCVARLVWFKGLHALVEAIPQVLKACANTLFVIVGDGPLRIELEARAVALGVADHLVFLGERHDVPELLQEFDLFVLPSVSEGMPVTILEAMEAARAVVATRVGGVPELVVDGVTGLLVPPRDPDALGAAIVRLLLDPAMRERMGQQGRERVLDQFSADAMVGSTHALFRRLLDAKAARPLRERV